MMGNRGIYHNGWTAVTRHRTPWDMSSAELRAFDDDVWELYNTSNDWTQARDIAAEQPDMLSKLQRQWLIEAVKFNVLPLDDRAAVRGIPELAGRPTLAHGNKQRFLEGISRISEHSVISTKDRSFSLTAAVDAPHSEPAHGVIAALGGGTGGFSLYAVEGKLKFTYNFFGLEYFETESTGPMPAGSHEVRMEFSYDGGADDYGLGGTVTLTVDGQAVGRGRVDHTITGIFSAVECFDVGVDTGSPVCKDYPAVRNRFNGRVRWVEVEAATVAPELEQKENETRLRGAVGTQ